MFQAQSLLQLVWVVPNPGRPQAAMGLQPLTSLIDQQATSSPRPSTFVPWYGGGGPPRADLEGAVGPIPNPSLLLPSSLLSPCINCRLPAPSIWSLVFGGWAAAAAAWWASPFRPLSVYQVLLVLAGFTATHCRPWDTGSCVQPWPAPGLVFCCGLLAQRLPL